MAPETLLTLGIVILLLPLLTFAVLIFFGKRMGRVSGYIGTTILGLDLLLAIYVLITKYTTNFAETIANGSTGIFIKDTLVQTKFTWFSIGKLDITVGMGIDNLTAMMLLVVTLISFLVHLFSMEYMKEDTRFPRFYAYLGIFTFSMLGIVLANNFLFMYVFWELVGLSSYLLIGFWYEKDSAANASKKAFLVNRVGDFGFLIGILFIYSTYGTFIFDEVFKAMGMGIMPFDSGTFLTITGILIFCGAIGKSAQFPLHVWLPDAMEGPTPVSALIHAATMVAAGVYMVARVFPIFTADASTVIAYTGAITAFIAATIAITQNDFKRVLAYSTVSQLGYMIMALGVGAFTTGFFHLVTHAWFKAALFLASGSVIYAMHRAAHHLHDHHTDVQDIRNLGGLKKTMPWTYYTFLFVTLALCGVPLTSGFLSKDAILASTLAFGMLTGHWIIPLIGFASAGMTAFYMFRLTILSFHGKPRTEIAKQTKENNFPIVFPLVLLAIISLWGFYSLNPTNAHTGWFYEKIQQPASAVPENLQWKHNLIEKKFDGENTGVAVGAQHKTVHEISRFEETVEQAHYPAMGLSILIAGGGILFAFMIYQFKLFSAEKFSKQLGIIYKFSFNKWYFDEIYAATVIGGTVLGAKFLALFDNYVIDGVVNGASWVTRLSAKITGIFDNVVVDGIVNLLAKITGFFGASLRKVQTGRIQTYVILAVIGLITLIYIFI
jgi:NADH-quinone oxidoreductase subunit L